MTLSGVGKKGTTERVDCPTGSRVGGEVARSRRGDSSVKGKLERRVRTPAYERRRRDVKKEESLHFLTA